MRGAWIIAKKDIRSLFYSPMFYIVAGLCTVVWTFMYIVSLNQFAQAATMMAFQRGDGGGPNLHFEVFTRHIMTANFLMIMAVAGLTMRLFAEEKRNRTFDLLLTSPVTSLQITMGKFIAGLTAAWALCLLAFLCPLAVVPFAKFDWGPLFTTFLGLLMVTSCYVAIGVLASAMTSQPVLAVIFGLIGNVLLWFMGGFLETGEGPIWQAIYEQVAVGKHLLTLVKGGLPVSTVVFFASVVFVCVFITQRIVESHRWS